MNRALVPGLLIMAGMLTPARAQAAPPDLELYGNVQVQAQKALWDNNADVNLDEFWGRANFGAGVKASDFSSCLNIRAFPEGWGFEPLTGLSVEDSLVAGVTKTQIARFIIEQAWVKYSWTYLDVRLGRFFTTTSKTVTLGNLLEQNPGTAFQGKLAYHNALEGVLKTGPVLTSLLLGAGDKNLNTGYLRIFVSMALLDKALGVGAGYRGNVFDLVHDGDAEVYDRFVVSADYEIVKNLRPYLEVGILDNQNRIVQANADASVVVPFVFGVTVPAGRALDAIAAEMEFLDSRVVSGDDVPVHWNIALDKKVSARSRFQLGIFSDAAGDAGKVRIALRYTGSLK